MTSATHFPTEPALQRADEAERIPFSATSAFRFIYEGGPGRPDFFEENAQRGDGPPLHRHPYPSWELCVEGRLRFVVGNEVFRIGPGDAVYVPPGTAHAYVVESPTARTVGINLSDGSFPRLQRRAAALVAASPVPDLQQIAALAKEHGLEVLGPPLAMEEDA